MIVGSRLVSTQLTRLVIGLVVYRLDFRDGRNHRQCRRGSGFLILTRGRRITAESESGERLREHRTQFRNTLGDDGLAFLQIGDALGQTVKLALGGGATLLDLRIGFLARLMYDCGGLDVRLLALGRGIRIGLVASVLGLTDQLIGFPLGRHTTLFEVLQQFVDLLRGLILLSGDVVTDLLDLGVDLAHRAGALDLGLISDFLTLGFGRINDFAGLALGFGHHLGHLLAHVGELLVGLGERRLNLIVGIRLKLGDLLIGAFAHCGNLLGRLRLHVGDFALLSGAFGSHLLGVLFARVAELKLDGLTLFGDGLGSFGAQLCGILVSGGGH